MDPRPEEDLVGVDVADPGEHLLIHQGRLDPTRGPLETRAELLVRDLESVRTMRARERPLGFPGPGIPGDLAQAAVVAEPDVLPWSIRAEDQADVFRSVGRN